MFKFQVQDSSRMDFYRFFNTQNYSYINCKISTTHFCFLRSKKKHCNLLLLRYFLATKPGLQFSFCQISCPTLYNIYIFYLLKTYSCTYIYIYMYTNCWKLFKLDLVIVLLISLSSATFLFCQSILLLYSIFRSPPSSSVVQAGIMFFFFWSSKTVRLFLRGLELKLLNFKFNCCKKKESSLLRV